MKKQNLIVILMSLIVFYGCGPKKKAPTLPMKIALAYGFDQFDKLNSIAYTWNVQVDTVRVVSRDWKWNIRERSVYYADADTSFTYSLDLPADEMPLQDKAFINDKYWLMYPFQLVWDEGYTYTVEEEVAAPISGKLSTKMIVVYNDVDGYTPGDAYDLYLDENYMIREWVFRRGNAEDGRAFTWENEKEFNGVKFATEHKNASGMRFIWFTDILVE